MSRTKKFLFLIPFLAFAGCNATDDIGKAENPLNLLETHKIEGTIHNIKITERDLPFIVNKTTEYKIVIPKENSYASKAASFIAKYILKSADAQINVVEYEGEDYAAEDKLIVLGVDELSKKAGVEKTNIDLEISGYQITTKDKSVFMYVNHVYGYQQVALSFLKNVLGYDRISNEIVLFKRDVSTLPEIDIVEIPDFQTRTMNDYASNNYYYETGYIQMTEVMYSNSKRGIDFTHNSMQYVSKSKNGETHPKWFASPLEGESVEQLCYTAHGDPVEYEAMVNEAAQGLIESVNDNKDCIRFNFTIMDGNSVCGCPACKEAKAHYGDADSGAFLKFICDVDRIIQKYLQDQADLEGKPKRKVHICCNAYYKMEKPPTKHIEDIGITDTTAIDIAPITANYQTSFYDQTCPESKSAADNIVKWYKTVGLKNIYYWLYDTNFAYYLYPYNTFAYTPENLRFTAENGALYMFYEGQHQQGAATVFSRFKEYLEYIFEVNVNEDYNTVKNHFFESYFREASEPMLKMFDELQSHMEYLCHTYSSLSSGNIYSEIAKTEYWPKGLLDRWLGYIDDAYAKIDDYKYSDATLFKVLTNNIKLESIFPRYAEIVHHGGKFADAELIEMKTSFINDCVALNVTHYADKNSAQITNLKQDWGV